MLRRRISAFVFAMLAGTLACAAKTNLKPGFNLFSKQQDVQLGQEASQQVLQQYQPVQDQFLQGYLKRIGQRLANTEEARQSGFPFTFTLLNENEINAFALPGGPMFVFTGLLKAVDNEAELAGVMAHEMSHVILRHGTNQASKANLIQLPAMLAGAVVGNGSMLGQLAQLGIGLGANSVLLKFSRTDESQADLMGSHLMAEAGYNPIEMARFFEKLDAQGGSRGPQFLSDHPNPGNRQRAIEQEIRSLPQQNYGFQTGDFQRAKAATGGLPAPQQRRNAQRSSYQPQTSAPSGGMQQLQGRTFAVAYPGNWQAFGDQNSSMVTIAPREGLVQQNGRTQVGYGAILAYFFPDQARDLRNATADLIHHLRTENRGLQVAGNSRRVRVDGNEGLVTMMQGNSPYGGAETDALLTVARPEGLFYMVFIAPSRDFQNLQGAFQQMINSIRFTG